MSVFDRLPFMRRQKLKRFDQNDWAQEYFTYAGNAYPLGGGFPASDNTEPIENNYVGYVNSAYKTDGALFAVCLARMLVFSEIRFQYQAIRHGRPGDLFAPNYLPDALTLLENPWPNGFTSDLVSKAIQHADIGGNHYVVSEGAGEEARLRILRPDWTDIVLTEPPDKARRSDIAGYLYKPGGTSDTTLWETFPIDGSKGTVAHWAPIPDPDAQFRGMSWMTPVLEELKADKAIMKHKRKFFENGATIQTVIGLKDAGAIDDEQFEKFQRDFNRAHQGVDNAYRTLFIAGGVDAKAISADMQQMDFIQTGAHGEQRICAAGQVPGLLIGLEAPYTRSSLSSDSYEAAKSRFIDMTMRPLWRNLSQTYSVLVPKLRNARLWYDARDVAFLKSDVLKTAQIQQVQAATAASYIQAGFEPGSVTLAIRENDMSLLKHTGLTSVQLLPPGTQHQQGGAEPASNGGGSKNAGKSKPAALPPASAKPSGAPANNDN